jgi:hypothetical protein
VLKEKEVKQFEKSLTPMTGQVVSVVIGRDGQADKFCGPG